MVAATLNSNSRSDDHHQQHHPSYLILRADAGTCLDQLWNNRDVQHVSVECDVPLTEKEYLSIFRSIAHHRKMTNLRVRCLQNPLPITALSAVMNDPVSRLSNLILEGVCLEGKIREYAAFVEILRLCSIQRIHLDCCEFANKIISLDPFVRALSSIPTLEYVYLADTEIAPQGTQWDCRYLGSLLTQIRSLELREMPDMGYTQFCILAQALESPSCALKELTIQNQFRTDEWIFRLAQMLQKNTSLEALTIIGVNNAENVGIIAQSLQQHPSKNLQRLSFPGNWGQAQQGFYSSVRKDLLKMVQTNTSISYLFLGGGYDDDDGGGGDDDYDNTTNSNDLSMELEQYIKINLDNRRASLAKFGGGSSMHTASTENSSSRSLATTGSYCNTEEPVVVSNCGASFFLALLQ